MLSTLEIAFWALLIEAVVGYPAWLFRAIGHPVSWMGALIGALDRSLNRPARSFRQRRRAGVAALAVLLIVTLLVTAPIESAVAHGFGLLVVAAVAAMLPAQRSLYSHVAAVADALDSGGEEAGRRAVALIVGRNPERLDTPAIARAAIESLAENFSDGVVAPAFWLAVGGLPGGALYKAINTADSMIGHKSDRHLAFGWAAARLDDWVNLPASRLSAVWILGAAFLTRKDWRGGWAAVHRDAVHHRSPNAGWPEAAMAGALGLQLAGPRYYDETLVDDAFMGRGRRGATSTDIRRALRLYQVACALQGAALLVILALLLA